MENTVALLGDKVILDADRDEFYSDMLNAIVNRVFDLLGPEFDKRAYLTEVQKGYSAIQIGQSWAIPVTMMLSMELGYCLGQLKSMGRPLDCDQTLTDLYAVWRAKLKAMLREEMYAQGQQIQ
jgi:hypothetical protein